MVDKTLNLYKMRAMTKCIDPFKFAAAGVRDRYTVPLSGMPRLLAAVGEVQQDSWFDCELTGSLGWENAPFLEIRVAGKVPLKCQRCMKVFDYSVDAVSKLAPVKSEKAIANLPSDCEALLVADGEVSLAEMAEEEILLLLPVVPLHDLADCAVHETEWSSSTASDKSEDALQRKNPFAALASIKKGED